MPATYIVIEGTEGAGKTTIARKIVDKLAQLDIPAKFIHEPDGDYDATTAAIRQITQDPSFPMNSRTEALLYNAARSQSLEGVTSARADGVVCIADRSYLSTLAVQFYGRSDIKDYQRLNDIIDFAVHGVWPDLTIVLDAPVDVLQQRAQDRGEQERYDDLEAAMLERIRAGYLWEANQRNMPVVYATGTADETLDEVWRHIAVALELQDTSNTQPVAVAEVLSKSPAARVLRAKQPNPGIANEEDSTYYVPATLPDDVQCDYCDDIERIQSARRMLTDKLSDYLARSDGRLGPAAATKSAANILQPLLPIACRHERLGALLRHDETIEIPRQLQRTLPHSTPGDEISLVSVWPRNEFSLLPLMLYPSLDLPINTLTQTMDSWSYELKAQLLETYISAHPTGSAHKEARYQWDCLMDVAAIVSLPDEILTAVRMQQLTPRYGYAMPQQVEEAGLADDYDAIFDMSLQLQSNLQSRGFADESQYATLLGHRQRFLLTLDGAQLVSLAGSTISPLIDVCKQDVMEHHVLLGSHLFAHNTNRSK